MQSWKGGSDIIYCGFPLGPEMGSDVTPWLSTVTSSWNPVFFTCWHGYYLPHRPPRVLMVPECREPVQITTGAQERRILFIPWFYWWQNSGELSNITRWQSWDQGSSLYLVISWSRPSTLKNTSGFPARTDQEQTPGWWEQGLSLLPIPRSRMLLLAASKSQGE